MLKVRKDAGIPIYGNGSIGGKGEGLVQLRRLGLRGVGKLKTEIISGEFYRRFMESGQTFDKETASMLRQIHSSFARKPISVRPSEKDENNPDVATSGENTSFMLPNSSGSAFRQFCRAIELAYRQFVERTGGEDEVAVVVNEIHGVLDRTRAGTFFYPMSSGVADSIFYYPVEDKMPEDGFARVAFGHGYATVRDDFDVVPVLTIAKPMAPSRICDGQGFFYAINMDREVELQGKEMETMSLLNIGLADPEARAHFGNGRRVDFDRLVGEDMHGYASQLRRIIKGISDRLGACQIEFTFNVINGEGVFHIVQLKKMRDPERGLAVPGNSADTLISTDRVQGHGVIGDIRSAIVVNPRRYRQEMHDQVRSTLSRLNACERNYILVCPGRVGTKERELGLSVTYPDISNASVVVEYGYTTKGLPYLPHTRRELTGGIYGSHAMYQMSGAALDDAKKRELMLLGSQGTHFITNIFSSGTIYLLVVPGKGTLDPWFWAPPEGMDDAPIYVKRFDRPVTAYANLFEKRCLIG